MIGIFQTAARVQEVCQQAGWKFCFIGAVALQRWGEPRFTKDVDLTVYTGFGNEEGFIDLLLRHFSPRMPDAAKFALTNRVVLLKSDTNVGIDVALGGLPFEAQLIDRASYFRFPVDINLLTCSAEDLIITKSFADRGQDWIDIDRVLVRQGEKLDWTYIYKHLKELLVLKESPEILERLKKLRAERDANP